MGAIEVSNRAMQVSLHLPGDAAVKEGLRIVRRDANGTVQVA
jgi:hypothetical protein